jgi:hypothetical protein
LGHGIGRVERRRGGRGQREVELALIRAREEVQPDQTEDQQANTDSPEADERFVKSMVRTLMYGLAPGDRA